MATVPPWPWPSWRQHPSPPCLWHFPPALTLATFHPLPCPHSWLRPSPPLPPALRPSSPTHTPLPHLIFCPALGAVWRAHVPAGGSLYSYFPCGVLPPISPLTSPLPTSSPVLPPELFGALVFQLVAASTRDALAVAFTYAAIQCKCPPCCAETSIAAHARGSSCDLVAAATAATASETTAAFGPLSVTARTYDHDAKLCQCSQCLLQPFKMGSLPSPVAYQSPNFLALHPCGSLSTRIDGYPGMGYPTRAHCMHTHPTLVHCPVAASSNHPRLPPATCEACLSFPPLTLLPAPSTIPHTLSEMVLSSRTFHRCHQVRQRRPPEPCRVARGGGVGARAPADGSHVRAGAGEHVRRCVEHQG